MGKLREKNMARLTICFKFQDLASWETQTCREPWAETALALVPTFRAGCFLKSTVTAFSSFSPIGLTPLDHSLSTTGVGAMTPLRGRASRHPHPNAGSLKLNPTPHPGLGNAKQSISSRARHACVVHLQTTSHRMWHLA